MVCDGGGRSEGNFSLVRRYPTKRMREYVSSGVWVVDCTGIETLETQLRWAAAHLTASRLPLAASTPNHMTKDAAVHIIPNKNGSARQLSCVLSMIVWTT